MNYSKNYQAYLISIELAQEAFESNPNKKTATKLSQLKNTPFTGEVLTEEGKAIEREEEKKRLNKYRSFALTSFELNEARNGRF